MPPSHIGIAGAKGSGKTSLATLIEESLSYKLVHLADPLREELCSLLNGDTPLKELLLSRCHDDEREAFTEVMVRWYRLATPTLLQYPATKEEFRRLMQVWGTDIRRNDNPNYWIERLSWAVPSVVPDVRFLNEVEHIRSLGGRTIYLWNDEKQEAKGNHASEALCPYQCDVTIDWPHDDPITCVNNALECLKSFGIVEQIDRELWLRRITSWMK